MASFAVKSVLAGLLMVATVVSLKSDGLPGTHGVVVPANMEWQRSGIRVKPHQHYWVSASGKWSNVTVPESEWIGPRGHEGRYPGTLVPEWKIGALIMKIGSDVPMLVGTGTGEGVSANGGEMAFAMNDVSGTYADNVGSLAVSVRLGLLLSIRTIALAGIALLLAILAIGDRSRRLEGTPVTTAAPGPPLVDTDVSANDRALGLISAYLEERTGVEISGEREKELADMMRAMPEDFAGRILSEELDVPTALRLLLGEDSHR